MAQGYWRRPEETEQTFAGFRADTGEGPFLRTGDLGFLCAGELFITGRCKDLIVIDGHRYYPHDVEFTVQTCHPALVSGRGAVFAVTPAPGALEQLIVVQEVDRGQLGDVEFSGVVDAIRAAITVHHGVEAHAVVLVEQVSIPTTSSGKIRRGQCGQQFIDGELAVVAQWQAPSDELSLEDLEAAAKMVGVLQEASTRQAPRQG